MDGQGRARLHGEATRRRWESNPRITVLQTVRRNAQSTVKPETYEKAENDLAENLALFPDLAAVIEAWPSLPEDVRRTIVHVARASVKPEDR